MNIGYFYFKLSFLIHFKNINLIYNVFFTFINTTPYIITKIHFLYILRITRGSSENILKFHLYSNYKILDITIVWNFRHFHGLKFQTFPWSEISDTSMVWNFRHMHGLKFQTFPWSDFRNFHGLKFQTHRWSEISDISIVWNFRHFNCCEITINMGLSKMIVKS